MVLGHSILEVVVSNVVQYLWPVWVRIILSEVLQNLENNSQLRS